MKVVTSFMCMNQDGMNRISYTYNELDENGIPTKRNAKASFYVLDDEANSHIEALKVFIKNRVEG